MGWFNWFASKKPTTTNTCFPRVIFDCLPGGRIEVNVDWPDTENQDQMVAYARGLAGMMFYINDGQLLPLMQQAVVLSGRLKNQDRLAEHILTVMMNLYRQNEAEQGKNPRQKKEGPVVAADEVFNHD